MYELDIQKGITVAFLHEREKVKRRIPKIWDLGYVGWLVWDTLHYKMGVGVGLLKKESQVCPRVKGGILASKEIRENRCFVSF